MRKIYQTDTSPGLGNCHQAVIASLFDLDLDQVPNFIKYKRPEYSWAQIYSYFIQSIGWEFMGSNYFTKFKATYEIDLFLDSKDSVGGLFDAVVPSRTNEGAKHAVLIDQTGHVVHDPNPNERWLGEYVLTHGVLEYYSMLRRANDNRTGKARWDSKENSGYTMAYKGDYHSS